MMFKNVVLGLSLIAFVGLTGCSSPWKVVKKAQTNPFTKSEMYTVSKTKANNLSVGEMAEGVYLQQIGSQEQKRWRVGKSVFSNAFAKAIKTHVKGLNVGVHKPVKPNHFHIYSELYFASPYSENKGTMVKIRVRLMQRNRTFDILLLQFEAPAKGRIGRRMQVAGAELGKRLAKYLNERVR